MLRCDRFKLLKYNKQLGKKIEDIWDRIVHASFVYIYKS